MFSCPSWPSKLTKLPKTGAVEVIRPEPGYKLAKTLKHLFSLETDYGPSLVDILKINYASPQMSISSSQYCTPHWFGWVIALGKERYAMQPL